MARDIHFAGCTAASGTTCTCETTRYWFVFGITLVIVGIELAGSVLSGSIALWADTAHVALDSAASAISVYVAYAVQRHADPLSVRVRWMRISNLLLLGALVWIGFQAITRLFHPQEAIAWEMMATAVIAAPLNLAQHRLIEHDHSVTARAQRLHVLGDLISSTMVVIGGALIWVTGIQMIDPLISLAIVVLIGRAAIMMVFSNQNTDHHSHSHHCH